LIVGLARRPFTNDAPPLRADETNFGVRNYRLCHLKRWILWVFWSSSSCGGGRRCKFNHGGTSMNNKLLSCLIAGALTTTLALASPAFGRGGGMGGGMHGGGMGGGMHVGGVGGGMHVGGVGGGMHVGAISGGTRFGGMSAGPRFSGARFAGAPFAAHAALSPRFSHAALSPRFSHAAFSPRFSRFAFHHRFHHRFNRFAFVGVPFAYAAYDGCWRRVWTPYGLQWIDVCGDYGYY
jgi:hypothetical protein